MRAYLRSLNPELPRSVQMLQAGGLANAFGNGIAYPFLFLYLHNVRGISTAVAGLVVATNGAVSVVSGPAAGALVDRIGGRGTLLAALGILTLGYAGYAAVERPWQGFVASAVTGVGNGAFWPAQSTLVNALTPRDRLAAAFGMQRVVMNAGFGLGAVAGGLIASTAHPRSFQLLFAVDALTFVAFAAVLLASVPAVRPPDRAAGRPGAYRDILRHRAFVAFVALNTVLVTAGFGQLDLLPVYMKNEAGVSERGVGLVFLVNTLTIVVAQLPVTRLSEGRRRMAVLGALAVTWACAWLATPLVAAIASGAAAAALFALTQVVFAAGECAHGAVQGPLVSDLAQRDLVGRYMALSASSWSLGFTAGPAIGGFLLGVWPPGLWIGAAAVCVAAGAAALALERAVPHDVRRSPHRR